MSARPTFDLICPVFNEEQTIPLFIERIKKVFAQLEPKYTCRLIFIDNASTDRSYELVQNICRDLPWVSQIVMSRNFGYQCSVECGLRHTDADYNGVVDVDCEDPPELFIDFLKFAEQGFDVVYGERLDRPESWVIKLMRKIFYRITRATADEHFVLDMAEFGLMNREVREAVLADQNSFPFIRASIGRVGFAIKNVPYKRHSRIAGQTHYNFWRMAVFAVAGILSSSTLWLRVPIYVFPFWVLGTVALLIGSQVTGQAIYFQSLVALAFVFVGFTATGISLYLARVYKNGLQRPNYFVNKKKSHLPKSRTQAHREPTRDL